MTNKGYGTSKKMQILRPPRRTQDDSLSGRHARTGHWEAEGGKVKGPTRKFGAWGTPATQRSRTFRSLASLRMTNKGYGTSKKMQILRPPRRTQDDSLLGWGAATEHRKSEDGEFKSPTRYFGVRLGGGTLCFA